MSSEQQQGQISDKDSQFSVDLKTNKIKKKSKKKKQQKKPSKIITSTYKKQKCLHFNKGSCIKGQTCTFSHDFQPQSLKTVCKYFLSNACTKGNQCNFLHSTQLYPCKFYHLQNRCNMKQQCRFSHDQVNKQYINDFIKDNKELILNLHKDQRINLIQDKNLKKQILNFITKQIPQTAPVQSSQQNINTLSKKHSFKGQLKLLALNNVNQQTQKQRLKPVDPRIKLKQMTASSIQKNIIPKIQETQRNNTQLRRNWITQIIVEQNKNNQQRVINRTMIEKFLYSYY